MSATSGNGVGGYSGDGGTATAASLNNPSGIFGDDNGHLYIADLSNNRVRIVYRDGIITTLTGNGTAGHSRDGGPAKDAQVSPKNVFVDTSGNIYLASPLDFRVRKIIGPYSGK